MGILYYWLYYKWQTNTFLGFRDPIKFYLSIFKFDMGIGVQCNTNIRMAHDILQGFGVHAAFRHVGAEGMAADMGCDFRKLHLINAVVFLHNMLKVLFPMQGNHGHIILVQEEKTGVAIDHRFCKQLFPIVDDPAETSHDVIAHGDEPLTAFGLGFLDDIPHISGSLQLMIHPDSLILEVNVRNGQSAKF